MSKENEKTLEVYRETANLYLENSKEHDRLDPEKAARKKAKLEELIRISLSSIPEHAKVLEIGSGDGTNAEYMASLGYDVTASDTAPDFIKAIREKGLNTIEFNALEDDFPEKYFAIFCWRVFVHFTKEDAEKIIERAYHALEDNGIFIFNAINRETRPVDDEWKDFEGEYHMGVERYYRYFQKSELDSMAEKTGFEITDFHTEGGDAKNKWLVYVLKKSKK